MPTLEFEIKNQIIIRVDTFRVVADSENYLYAHFNFLTDEWKNLVKTAIFVNEPDEPQVVILDENDTCLVPSEVLRGNGNYIYVSVFADSLITANRTNVFVEPSGYTGDVEDIITPTPSVYWQLIEMYEQLQDDMQHIDGGTFEDWREG